MPNAETPTTKRKRVKQEEIWRLALECYQYFPGPYYKLTPDQKALHGLIDKIEKATRGKRF